MGNERARQIVSYVQPFARQACCGTTFRDSQSAGRAEGTCCIDRLSPALLLARLPRGDFRFGGLRLLLTFDTNKA